MSQEKQILNYLKEGKTLTPIDALNKFDCFRLGARIWDLKKKGFIIEDIGEKNFSEYKLILKEQTELF